MTLKKRELKAIQLVNDGYVQPVNSSKFLVRSQSNPEKWYKVIWKQNHWCCDCADYAKHHKRCKHIYAVCYYLTLREITLGVKDPNAKIRCPKCGSNDHVIKRGIRYNRSGPMQRYYCKRCKIRFVDRTAFEGMRHKATAVVLALDLYYRGVSLRQIAEHLESIYGIKVTHGTVYNWIRKYVQLIHRYLVRFRVQTSDRWHADDTLVRVQGRHLVFWALLDSETRYLVALHVSKRRRTEDAQTFLKRGVETVGKRPLEIVTDGLPSYSEAIERECKMRPEDQRLIHVQGPLAGPLNNNKVERFHETLKGRVKTMYHLHDEVSAKTFAKGFATYYNFIKPHAALNGKTPAQAVGLMQDKSRWLDIILNAKKHFAQGNDHDHA